MDQVALVEKQIEDGQKLVDALVREGFEVTAACWVNSVDDGRWYLYLASKFVDDRGTSAAYQAVNAVLNKTTDLWIDPFEIKVVRASHPIAKDVRSLYQRQRAPIPTRYRGAYLGNVPIEEAYLYAPPTP